MLAALGAAVCSQPMAVTSTHVPIAPIARRCVIRMICLVEWVHVRGPNLARGTHPGSRDRSEFDHSSINHSALLFLPTAAARPRFCW